MIRYILNYEGGKSIDFQPLSRKHMGLSAQQLSQPLRLGHLRGDPRRLLRCLERPHGKIQRHHLNRNQKMGTGHDLRRLVLYEPDRKPGPILEAACWAHARRPFFAMADLAENARRKAQGQTPGVISPLAMEAVRRIDALFEIERSINGQSAEQRRVIRQELSAPLVADLESWMREQRAKLSGGNDLAKAMDYMLKRWTAFTRFLDDGRICLSNNAAERALRGIALGRRSWRFAGSDRGGQRAAAMYSIIVTAKMNDVDPQAWLGDVLTRIAELPIQKLDELLPWNWRSLQACASQAA